MIKRNSSEHRGRRKAEENSWTKGVLQYSKKDMEEDVVSRTRDSWYWSSSHSLCHFHSFYCSFLLTIATIFTAWPFIFWWRESSLLLFNTFFLFLKEQKQEGVCWRQTWEGSSCVCRIIVFFLHCFSQSDSITHQITLRRQNHERKRRGKRKTRWNEEEESVTAQHFPFMKHQQKESGSITRKHRDKQWRTVKWYQNQWLTINNDICPFDDCDAKG